MFNLGFNLEARTPADRSVSLTLAWGLPEREDFAAAGSIVGGCLRWLVHGGMDRDPTAERAVFNVRGRLLGFIFALVVDLD